MSLIQRVSHYIKGCANRLGAATPIAANNLNASLATLQSIDGAIMSAIVDSSSGMILGQAGTGLNIETAAVGNMEVVLAKIKTIQALGLQESIEDILITIDTQFHIIRPIAAQEGVFIYLILAKSRANLATSRLTVRAVEAALQF
ncbi:MAG: hypothetical protein PXX73_00455 [Sideroxydans sp.]|nr:hypothetical protein [Sideroxydans sp.]